jgi:predicted ATPase with chaperone activity
MRSTDRKEAPKSIEEAGLDRAFVAELLLKHLLYLGDFRMADVAERVKLPISLVEPLLEEHRKDQLIEVKSAANYSSMSYLFRLTEAGRRRAHEAMELCRYAGPAPVSLEAYRNMVQLQTVRSITICDEELKAAFSHLVVSDAVRRRLGPALISGQAVLIFGPSGNGKTSIAEALGRALPENIYLPYAITVGGQIINVFDPVCHSVADPPGGREDGDARWVLIKRPVIVTGGELTLKMLDLNFDPSAKFYDASLQMKANNGIFILDDFGRQQVEPVSILNRWIVPLERGIDHMTLHTGKKFVIPFDVLALFSTDLEPKDLIHQAFLRRLRYKVRIERPTDGEYLAIFRAACKASGLEFDPQAYAFLVEQGQGRPEVQRSACHARDLIDLIVTKARYEQRKPQFTLETIRDACLNYFGEL